MRTNPSNTTLRGTTVALVAAVLLLPGCALRKGPPDPAKVQRKMEAQLSSERALIEETVADSEAAARLIELLDDRDRLVAQHAESIRSYRERMRSLNADYNAGREDFDQALAEYNEQRRESQRAFAELIDEMKKEASPEEWKAIAKYQIKKLNPRELVYGQPGGGS